MECCIVGYFTLFTCLVVLVDSESTYAGDRDSRFLNCAVPCQFECNHPGSSAKRLLATQPVPSVMQNGKFIFHPANVHDYTERLHRALTKAYDGIAKGSAQAKESSPELLEMIARQPAAVTQLELPMSLKALGWSCEENCRYDCMIDNNNLRFFLNESSVHYYGKWPFTRVFGIQELLSSLFSFLNGVPYMLLLVSQKQLFSSNVRMAWVCGFWCMVASNTWLQSTAFHARESPLTEALDYHGASMYLHTSLSTSLFVNMPSSWPWWVSICFSYLPVFAFWVSHVSYLSFVRFDYGYNMKVVVAVGISASTCWSIWFFRVRKRTPYAWKVMVASWGPYLVLPLELLDFPPYWGLADAHAIWHVLTVPLAAVLCSFMKNIVEDDIEITRQKDKRA